MFGKKFEKEIKVQGMHCVHCAKKVEDAIKSIKGVKGVDVDLQSGKVKILSKVEIDENTLNTEISNIGYQVIFDA